MLNDAGMPDLSGLWRMLPPWIGWVAMDKDGLWFGHYREPVADVDDCEMWVKGGIEDVCGSLYIPGKYAPKWDGDWRRSLTKRMDNNG